MRFLLTALFIAAGFGIAQAKTRIDGAQVIERGYYELGKTKTISDSSISTGQRTEATATLKQSAARIEVENGTVLGFSFIVKGQPREGNVTMRVIWRYPDPGMKNPATGKTKYTDEYDTPVAMNSKQTFYWSVGDPWQQVPGIWTCEIWHGQRRVVRQDFEVVRK